MLPFTLVVPGRYAGCSSLFGGEEPEKAIFIGCDIPGLVPLHSTQKNNTGEQYSGGMGPLPLASQRGVRVRVAVLRYLSTCSRFLLRRAISQFVSVRLISDSDCFFRANWFMGTHRWNRQKNMATGLSNKYLTGHLTICWELGLGHQKVGIVQRMFR
jgi:hypothetical protein